MWRPLAAQSATQRIERINLKELFLSVPTKQIPHEIDMQLHFTSDNNVIRTNLK